MYVLITESKNVLSLKIYILLTKTVQYMAAHGQRLQGGGGTTTAEHPTARGGKLGPWPARGGPREGADRAKPGG
jgi:hypothetical protein